MNRGSGDRELRRARFRVPGTTSNLGAAFDAVGLALELYLTVEVAELRAGPSRLRFRGQDAHLVREDETNLIWRTMVETARERSVELPPFALDVCNEIPITRGLGSSATARLAAVAAADFLGDLQLGREGLLEIAARAEGHPDNVAPALHGGLVASISSGRVLWTRIDFPSTWTVVTVTPDFELETRKAREALPASVPHRDAVYNVQRAAFLLAQLARGCREGVREAMRDRLHQPYRSPLVPGLDEILALEDLDGLIGVALSGAGPTVMALADAGEREIGARIQAIFASRGIGSEVRLLKADNCGLVKERSA